MHACYYGEICIIVDRTSIIASNTSTIHCKPLTTAQKTPVIARKTFVIAINPPLPLIEYILLGN